MKDFHGLFSAFLFFKEHKLHMHLGPSISEGQVFLDFYHQKLLFYDFVQRDSFFMTYIWSLVKYFSHKTRIFIIQYFKDFNCWSAQPFYFHGRFIRFV